MLALSKAFALASASDWPANRLLPGYLLCPRWSREVLVWRISSERELAIQQIVRAGGLNRDRGIISVAAGIKSPDIFHPSDEFLAEVQQMERKNLALEVLRKATQRRHSLAQRPTVQTAFSERWKTPWRVTTPMPSPPPRCCRS